METPSCQTRPHNSLEMRRWILGGDAESQEQSEHMRHDERPLGRASSQLPAQSQPYAYPCRIDAGSRARACMRRPPTSSWPTFVKNTVAVCWRRGAQLCYAKVRAGSSIVLRQWSEREFHTARGRTARVALRSKSGYLDGFGLDAFDSERPASVS